MSMVRWARVGVPATLVVALLAGAGSGVAAADGCPNADLRTGAAARLPDCRGYELVSPVQKDGSDISADRTTELTPIRASADGRRVSFSSQGVFAGAASGNLNNTYMSRRSGGAGGGWTTQGISPPLRYTPAAFATVSDITLLDDDLRHAFLRTVDPVLTPDAQPGGGNAYIQDLDTGAYTLLTPGVPLGGGLPSDPRILGAADDRSHVILSDLAPRLPEAPDAYAQIYDSSGGALHLVSRLLDGTAAANGTELATSSARSRAVSRDGRRVYYTAYDASFDLGLYLTQDATTTTLVNASQRATPDPVGTQPPQFWAASSDGGSVLFTSAEKLTDDATAAVASADLYRYDVAAGTLTDLTVAAGGANVQGVVAASDDARTVFFVASGAALAAGAQAGETNLYVLRGGTTTFVARLRADDPATGLLTLAGTKAVTPDGGVLVFTSHAPLAGSPGGDHTQLFRYVAATGALSCLSCAPGGAASTGDVTVPPGRRVLAPDGHRVFFETASAIDPRDSNGRLDVYEWEDGHVALISTGTSAADSTFADAGADGTDVFFTTRERLAPADVDDSVDLYDARAGGGSPAPPATAPAPCDGDGCRGPASPTPPDPVLGSVTFAGPGNLPETAPAPPSLRVAAISAARRAAFARTGRLVLRVTAGAPGRVTARARAKVGGKTVTVASTHREAPRSKTTMSLVLRLTKAARAVLARHRTLAVPLEIRLGATKKTARLTLHRSSR